VSKVIIATVTTIYTVFCHFSGWRTAKMRGFHASMIIAQPFMAGMLAHGHQSPIETAEGVSSLTGLGNFGSRNPTAKAVGYFQKQIVSAGAAMPMRWMSEA
jgi:hypothetical protein